VSAAICSRVFGDPDQAIRGDQGAVGGHGEIQRLLEVLFDVLTRLRTKRPRFAGTAKARPPAVALIWRTACHRTRNTKREAAWFHSIPVPGWAVVNRPLSDHDKSVAPVGSAAIRTSLKAAPQTQSTFVAAMPSPRSSATRERKQYPVLIACP